jgi:hypothetical protein
VAAAELKMETHTAAATELLQISAKVNYSKGRPLRPEFGCVVVVCEIANPPTQMAHAGLLNFRAF